MAISLGILFGIIAMIGWGVSDFFIAKSVKKSNVIRVFIWSQLLGLIILLPFLLFFNFPAFTPKLILLFLLSGLLGIISLLAFYKGLQVGNLSVISPVSSSAAVVTVLLSLIFLNEKLKILQGFGIGLIILGAILASFSLHNLIKLKLKNFMTGVEYAIVAAIGWGILFILIDMLVTELGWVLPIVLIKIMEIFYVLIFVIPQKKSIAFPSNVKLFVILGGIFEAIAFLSFGIGVSLEYTSIVGPLAFAFPAVAVILAVMFLKEKLDLNQIFGVVSVIIGIVLLSI
jgi:drug/metabolite transporter (DMT)-like permease